MSDKNTGKARRRNRRDIALIAGALAVSTVAILMAAGQVMAVGGAKPSEENQVHEGSATAVAIARAFILSKIQGLGIQVSDELGLHTDMVVTLDETRGAYRVEVGIFDTNGVSHNGYVEIENEQVKTAVLDGHYLT